MRQTVLTLSKAREHFSFDDGGYYVSDSTYTSLFKDDVVIGGVGRGGSKIGHGLMSPPDMALRLFLMAAQSANETGFEEWSYDFFVQALTIYEESISESRAQISAITLVIGTLYGATVFGYENYETLITKCAVHCSRLLKRVDQCRGVTMCSHLFWVRDDESGAGTGSPTASGASPSSATAEVTASTEGGEAESGETPKISTAAAASGTPTTTTGGVSGLMAGSGGGLFKVPREEGKPAYRDGKRVLECLQKALKIADSVMDQNVNVELFVEILERYIWYFEKRNDAITVKYLNSLIELIQTNLSNIDSSTSFLTGADGSTAHHGPANIFGTPLSANTTQQQQST
ncbi:Vacuolar protein sorting-associated protein 35, partial [Quaeritorhiza haematococci]